MKPANSIQQANDLFRQTFIGGTVLLTKGIYSQKDADVVTICQLVMRFDKFNRSNDPYHEHDFGQFEYKGTMIFWKIDYYDKSKTKASPNPADLNQTHRVLTIMTTDEY